MAKVTLLSWNVENLNRYNQILSNRTYQFGNEPNDNALISYIAQVIITSRANIASLLEVSAQIKHDVGPKIVNALRHMDPENASWFPISSNSIMGAESYLILWRKDPDAGKGFLPVTNDKDDVVCGFADKDKEGHDIPYPSHNDNLGGGRKPFFVLFRTRDTKEYFTVLAYHNLKLAGTGPVKNAEYGVEEIAKAQVINEVIVNTNAEPVPVKVSFISGDFNVPFDGGDVSNSAYKDLLAISKPVLPPSRKGNREDAQYLTWLESKMLYSSPNPLSYRASLLDNIFIRGAEPQEGHVLDLIVESFPDHSLATSAQPFKPEGIYAGLYRNDVKIWPLTTIQGQQLLSCWAFVRGAISDHLPVFTTLDI